MRSCVVIPTYNEKENIEDVITRVLQHDVDILIVDDSSPDGTSEIVKNLMLKYRDRLRLEIRSGKMGLGKAYVYGFTKCIEGRYDIICQMDADLSHDPDALDSLITPVANGEADLVIGSRYVDGGVIPKWTLLRRLLSRGGNLYTRIMLNVKTKDTTAGFRAYKADLLRDMLKLGIHSDGYGFQIEMTYCAKKLGANILEVPISFADRIKGSSKMGGFIIVEALSKVTFWSIRDRIWRPILSIFGHKTDLKADKNSEMNENNKDENISSSINRKNN